MPTLENARIKPPGPPDSYLAVVNQLMPAIRILETSQPPLAIALSMLCAHTLECALKALLSRNGDDRCVRRFDIHHNISKLWKEAQSNGLSSPIPDWAQRLSDLHDRPFHLRYLDQVHALVTPNPHLMRVELEKLIARMEGLIRSP